MLFRFCEMGNSRWRQNRNYIREEPRQSFQRWHNNPPSIPHASSRYGPNSVPLWEMQFCKSVGSVPWWKVVNSKKYMNCHKNILEWDDSAVEEAFHNAKQRFWAQINGLPCDISPPDPDIYIDNINYDLCIDPELVLDLDREYVAHDEELDGRTMKARKKNHSIAVSEHISGGHSKKNHSKNEGNSGNQWECGDQWDILVNKTMKPNDPWGRSYTHSNEDVNENAWEDFGAKSRSQNQGENNFKLLQNTTDVDCLWKQGCQGAADAKGKTWVDSRDNSRGWGSWNRNNKGLRNLKPRDNPWGHSISNEALRHPGWRDPAGTSHGWKKWDTYNKEPNDLELKLTIGGWDAWDDGGLKKREGTYLYVPKYKKSRFQGNDIPKRK